MRHHISTYFLCSILLHISISCSQHLPEGTINQSSISSSRADSISTLLSGLSYQSLHDSVISTARPELEKALSRCDTLTAIYCGIFMAQSYLFLENMDSVKSSIDLLLPLKDFPVPPYVHIMQDNVLGSYSLRTSLDYSKALSYYIDGLSWAEKAGSINNKIALLSNIVNIFYIQNSSKGLDYAENAYKSAMSNEETSSYAKCAACIAMVQMLLVQGDNQKAGCFLKQAREYAEEDRAISQFPFISILSAQLYQAADELDNAQRSYDEAIAYLQYTDPGTASFVYLEYGDFLAETGKNEEAIQMYRKGLRISESSGNLEYRHELLGHIADLTYLSGDRLASAEYTRMYKVYSDSIASRRESEFHDLILSKLQTEHDKQILAKELERQKTVQKLLTLWFILAIVLILSVLLLMLYRRQKKMYRELVEKHQEFISRLQLKSGNADADGASDNADRKLFNRIEDMMRNDKIYRSKNLSLETLTEKLGTNRTYCSKAINTFSGLSFSRYVDSFRIEEAVRVISESTGKILFKQLADDLGYKSLTVFSNAFQRETGCSPSIYLKEIRGYNARKKSHNL